MDEQQLKRDVDAYVDEIWEDAVEDIRTLVKIESVEDRAHAEPGKPWGPAANVALVAAERIAERLGLAVTDLDGYIGYADLAGASDACIATIAHTDIVPLGLGWNFPALDVTRKDGYLIGRGVLDDKGPFILSLYAAHFFARRVEATGEKLPYTLRCIIGNNEETSMGDVPVYLERCGEPAFCFSPDADFPLICGEKGITQGQFRTAEAAADGRIVELDGGTVANAIPGLATALVRADAAALPAAENIEVEPAGEGLARISAHGIGGHASMPAGTANAIGLLARYLLDAGLVDDASRAFVELQRELTEDTDGTHTGIASCDDKFGPLTCIAGTVRTVDGHFVQTIDSRYPTSTTGDAIAARMGELAAAHGCAYTKLEDKVPFYIDPECPEISTLLTTYSEYTGKKAEAFCIGGGTYARKFKRACAFGPHENNPDEPAWVGMEHGADEGISEADLKRALKIYIVSIARLMQLDLESK
ncbi:Sapep family Mn(2+)-dependent dipeptidase [Paratractidigestivibacter sp.]|uniref:Sapep family Mn(2+)-dependent dipeptidase n=1 Tax=Paratractidigestivibacter sp. TaxID=2847316 RepID=UPI002ABDF830|nr:Sapep family Mn(2+)-dependent dipeptidase [Paratractidigestivibacter sp.]